MVIFKMDSSQVSFFILSLAVCCISQNTDVSVQTKVGTFIGFEKDVNIDGKTVVISKFLGIPFAEPPVGQLRFEKSIAKSSLKEPLVTKKYSPECVQLEFFAPETPTTEDCLYLNVFTPKVDTSNEKLAVMVWIHGGGFVMGSANIYVADTLAAFGNVIVVTINYRVSVLGFLNAGTDKAGNYGLWDQQLAIKWVHDNIEGFGGDNERITIFGESSGAASVIYQGLHPENKGLFQRIISQSGSASSPWASSRNFQDEAKEFSSLVGCKTNNMQEMVDCLRNTDVGVIRSTLNDFTNGLFRVPFPLMPSVDQDFVKVSPLDYLNLDNDALKEEHATLSTFDLLIGINEAEGAGHISPLVGIYDEPDYFLPNRTFFEQALIPTALKPLLGDSIPNILKELVIAEYTDWNDPENPFTIRDQYIALQGDINFHAPLYSTVSAHVSMSEIGPYVYHFAFEPSAHAIHTPNWVNKANHGDEMQFVFGGDIDFTTWGSKVELTPWEIEISKTIMTLWTNFAKTGNPNTPTDIGLDWQPYTLEKHRYLELTRELGPSSVRERLNERKTNFWSKVFPAVSKAVTARSRALYTDTCEGKDSCSP